MATNPQTLLRIGYGLVPIVAGADKFTNYLVDWEKYLAPAIERTLPVRGSSFMKAVGIVEIAAGALVLSRWSKLGAYLVAGWLGAIAANLIASRDNYDIAARDVLLALGAFSLARMSPMQAGRRASAVKSESLPPESIALH